MGKGKPRSGDGKRRKQAGDVPVPLPPAPSDEDYKAELLQLQIELVKLQRYVIETGQKLLILFEGRDGGGKDGAIKRFVQHLSPREYRVVALSKPSDRDRTQWYFQRFAGHLPAAEEIVLFNRSWYNRAGVERVMGFCTEEEYSHFMDAVVPFEHMLVGAGITLFKYYLDISRDEQKKRLKERREDPLKQWKVSPIDAVAIKHWDDYSRARNAMFARTHSLVTPWRIVRADDKRLARLNLIKDVLSHMDYPGKRDRLTIPDPEVVFVYDDAYLKAGMIAP